MKREHVLTECWKVDLLILSAIFIRIRRESIPGGLIGSGPREKNAGWRIDYFLTSAGTRSDRLEDARIHTEIMGSDQLSGGIGDRSLI